MRVKEKSTYLFDAMQNFLVLNEIISQGQEYVDNPLIEIYKFQTVGLHLYLLDQHNYSASLAKRIPTHPSLLPH